MGCFVLKNCGPNSWQLLDKKWFDLVNKRSFAIDLNAGSLIKIYYIEPLKVLTCLHIIFLCENRLIQQKEFLRENRWFAQSLQFWFETFDFQIWAMTGDQ